MSDTTTSVETPDFDVIVAGGGLAGLSAGLRIMESVNETQVARSFVVLEADDDPGGRVETLRIADDGTVMKTPPAAGSPPGHRWIDVGGEFVGGTQDFVQHYIQRFGIKTSKTYLPQDKDWLYEDKGGTQIRFPGNNPFAFPGGGATVSLLGYLDQLCLSVRPYMDRPWDCPLAAQFDGITVKQWADAYFQQTSAPQRLKNVFLNAVRTPFSAEPEELSMFFALYYAAAAGSFSRLVDVTGGEGAAEATRLTKGAFTLVDGFVTAITGNNTVGPDGRASHGSFGDLGALQRTPQARAVITGSKVTAIDDSRVAAGGLVHVTVAPTKGGSAPVTLKARKVIVAMSPWSSRPANQGPNGEPAGSITYTPALSRRRENLSFAMKPGRTIKGFAFFKRPFWRDQGLMGFALSTRDAPDGPLDWTLDNSLEGGDMDWNEDYAGPRYALMTFLVGHSADYWGNGSKTGGFISRQKAVFKHLQTLFGATVVQDELFGPNWYLDHDNRDEPLIGGCPTGVLPPNTLDLWHALREPRAGVHWAGTESATVWCGYMDGAIQSGIRAADEVVFSLLTAPPAPPAPPAPAV